MARTVHSDQSADTKVLFNRITSITTSVWTTTPNISSFSVFGKVAQDSALANLCVHLQIKHTNFSSEKRMLLQQHQNNENKTK